MSSSWLAEHLEDPDLVLADMRWREDGRGAKLYEQGRIPGAVYLDWSTDLVDTENPIAFMLAGPEQFARVMEDRGIGNDSVVVAYADRMGSGPFRLWWACRVYGHDNVRVLDGGFDKWVAEARPVSTDPVARRRVRWTPRRSTGLIATADEVAAATGREGTVVLDSRPPEQFRGDFVWFEAGEVPAGPDGIAQTPRGACRAGHVPGAVNVPYLSLYREDLTMKTPDELRSVLSGAGVDRFSKAITYCGCGISASALLFAVAVAGVDHAALYDASWEEWGRDPTRPVARG